MVSFSTPNSEQLQCFISSARTQPTRERRALTEEQFEAQYSPPQRDYDKVISFLTSNKITVAQTWTNRLLISSRGEVTDIERAFNVEIDLYQYHNTTFYMNTKEGQSPALTELGVAGIEISNLTMQPGIQVKNSIPQQGTRAINSSNQSDPIASNPSPTDLQNAYGTYSAISSGWTGAGKTIGIVDAYGDPTITSDVNTFDSHYGLPSFTLTVTGTGGSNSNWAEETALDVEWAHAMAPGANIMLQLSPSAYYYDLYPAINTLVSLPNPPNAISLSWGGPETSGDTIHSSIFSAAAAKGIEVYAATGDYGAYNGGSSLSVNYPAVDPNVIAVGGTTLSYDNSFSPRVYSETGWSGSGGGYSTVFSEPAYQSSAGITDPTGMRAIPDAALDADPSSGVTIVQGGSYIYNIGGTSLATPLMAGIDAISLNSINLHLNNAYLYGTYTSGIYSAWFNDIANGNNGYYNAGTGWDAITGLGSIDFHRAYNDTGYTFQIVVPTGGYYYFTWSLSSGNGVYGSYSVESSQGCTFFICDSADFATWSANHGAAITKYQYHYDVGSASWSLLIPFTDTWYFVFDNTYWPLWSKTVHLTLCQDLTGPDITITSPSASYEAGQTITLSASATDDYFSPNYMKVSATDPHGNPVLLNGYSYYYTYGSSISVDWNTPSNLGSGYYTITFVADDGAGNPSRSSASIWIYAQPTINQPSAVTFIGGTTGNVISWSASSGLPSSFSVTYTGFWAGSTYYTGYGGTLGSGSWSGGAIPQNIDSLSIGTHQVTCTVSDTNGYTASSTVTVTVEPKNTWAVGVNANDWTQYIVTNNTLYISNMYPTWFSNGTIWKLLVKDTGAIYGSPIMTTDLACGVKFDIYANSLKVETYNDSDWLLTSGLGFFTSSGDNFWNTYKNWATGYSVTIGSKNITFSYSYTNNGATTNLNSVIDKTSGAVLIYSVVETNATGTYAFRFMLTNTNIQSINPSPTINHPLTITYIVGATGNNVNWQTSSKIPDHYTISVNGGFATSYSWNGQAITYNVDGLTVGTYDVNCTVYDNQGRSASSTVTVTVLPPVPTIDQPSAITYVAGTTGNVITWHPSSQIPSHYTISVNGGSPTSYNWNGQTITYSVDGWSAGTYSVTCTAYDTQGRSASSTVTVTVQPPPTSSLAIIAVGGAIVAAVAVAAIVLLKKRAK